MSVTGLSAPSLASNPGPAAYSQSPRLPMAAVILALLTFGSAWVGKQQLDRLFYDLDSDRLHQAEETLNAVVEQQRVRLLASVRILADDTRIRSTAMTTGFDEGTIRDVLDDLKKASEVNVLAVLDERGKVRAITGAEGLRQMDLSSSPVIRAALEHPASYTWTLPDQVVVIGVAPIRVGPRVSALLLMGITLGTQQLSGIERSLGVMVAIFSGDRKIAGGSKDEAKDEAKEGPKLAEVFRVASATADADSRQVPGYPDFMTRATRTSESATAAKVIWVVPSQGQSSRARLLRILLWLPVSLVVLTFAYLIWMIRKRNGGV
jgi:Double sensory domain of two-component sensor kinase